MEVVVVVLFCRLALCDCHIRLSSQSLNSCPPVTASCSNSGVPSDPPSGLKLAGPQALPLSESPLADESCFVPSHDFFLKALHIQQLVGAVIWRADPLVSTGTTVKHNLRSWRDWLRPPLLLHPSPMSPSAWSYFHHSHAHVDPGSCS